MTLLLRKAPASARTVGSSAHWALTCALVLLLLMALGALGPLLRGSGWWFACAFVGIVVLCAAAVFRQLRLAAHYVPLASFGVLIAVLTLLFGNGSGLLWLVPTGQTLGIFVDLMQGGSLSIQQQTTPAEPTQGIVFLLAGGAGLIALAIDALAITLRWPALAGLPVLIPVAVPGLIVEGGAEVVSLVLTGTAYLVLLRVDMRLRRAAEANNPDVGRDAPRIVFAHRRGGPGPLWGSLAVGGIGLISALVLSTATPELTASNLVGTGSNGRLFSAGVSPLIDLGQDLRRPAPGPDLHYTTTGTELPYFKLLTLDEFVGTSWTARSTRASSGDSSWDDDLTEMAPPPGLSRKVKTESTKTDVVIDGVDTTWLPVPSPTVRVNGLNGTWYSDPTARAITSSDATTRGQRYTVTALDLKPTAEQLRNSSTTYPASVRSSLALATFSPEIIQQTAQAVTADAASPYDSAVAIQRYLRSGSFTYDTESPVKEGFDGGGADVIAKFLEVKRGYCVHFASAMAIMARSVGIPARIALGYLPGAKASELSEGKSRYDIDSHDLHSWPELYFVGVGWVPFEPTPGRGTVPDYATPAAASAEESTPQSSAAATAPRSGEQARIDDLRNSSGAAAATSGPESFVRAGAALALATLVLMAPGMVRLLRRRSRIRAVRAGKGGAASAWAELADTAIDHGVDVSDRETPRSLAARLTGVIGSRATGTPEVTAALQRLLVAEERASYGRPDTGGSGGDVLAEDLSAVIGALHAASSRRVRWRAAALPASLWPSVLGWQNGGVVAGA